MLSPRENVGRSLKGGFLKGGPLIRHLSIQINLEMS